MLSKIDQNQVSNFDKLIAEAGVELNAANILKCIGFAKQAMLAGECSVEAYYKAKELLLLKVECVNEWVN